MRELKVNLWTAPADALCITINGVVKRDGNLVMGAGVAKEAALRWPNLPKILGEAVSTYGLKTVLMQMESPSAHLFAIPTKYHYKDKSDIHLIEKSLEQLVQYTDMLNYASVALPRPGCGKGGLDWQTEVKPLCEKLLDDRFIVVDFPPHFISMNR